MTAKKSKFCRNCPTCAKILTYASNKSLRRANDGNYQCKQCAYDKRNNEFAPIKFNPSYYNTANNNWFRVCKECKELILYTSYDSYCNGKNNDCVCKSCSISAAHASEEYQQIKIAMIEKLKVLWNDPNSVFNSEEYHQHRIIGLQQGYQKCLEESKGICDPVVRKKAMQATCKSAHSSSKGEQELFQYVKEYGFIHNEMSYQVAGFWPDIIHFDKKIIIEYNGDLFHANPELNKYATNDSIVKLPGGKVKTAGEIREFDKNRTKLLTKEGYTVIVVWENDFQNKREQTINKLINTLASLL
jgi:G:T-mismatch repair DNA endonuclease (very short patch repair protein)